MKCDCPFAIKEQHLGTDPLSHALKTQIFLSANPMSEIKGHNYGCLIIMVPIADTFV